jgi:hypothetical protein
MSKYYCKICDFRTEKKQNWYSHKKSKKHLRKLEENRISETERNSTETERNSTETERNSTETERNSTETERNSTETRRVRPQKNENELYECPDCNKKFTKEQAFYLHIKYRCITEENNQCEYCGKEYKKLKFLEKHELKCRKRPQIFNQTNITNNNTISDMLMSIGATKEELEVYKKSQTYKDDLAYVNEQRKYRNEIKNVKKDHCYDLINHKDEILEKMK